MSPVDKVRFQLDVRDRNVGVIYRSAATSTVTATVTGSTGMRGSAVFTWTISVSAPDLLGLPQGLAVNVYSTGYLAAYGAMMALARRATERGSWHVQVSLSQTCMWYQRLGDDNELDAADSGDIEPFLAEMETTDFGRIQYLTPALHLSETPPRWDLPPARQGAHKAEWVGR